MLSAGILIAVFALTAIAALYVAVRVQLASGRHGGGSGDNPFSGAHFVSAQFSGVESGGGRAADGQPAGGHQPGGGAETREES
jgi:hypothetical protein